MSRLTRILISHSVSGYEQIRESIFGYCGIRHNAYVGWGFKGMADSFDSGFPIGVKVPCWHTILRLQSLVCYAIPKNAAQKVLLCDSSKFDGRAPFKQCKLEDVDILVSEDDRAQHFAAYSDRVKLL